MMEQLDLEVEIHSARESKSPPPLGHSEPTGVPAMIGDVRSNVRI
jgi:hypothetical protein